jgi:hypothetical protein
MIARGFDGDYQLLQDSRLVAVGDVVTDFRGADEIVTGGTPPQNERSSGHVTTARGSFYPRVFSLTWSKK